MDFHQINYDITKFYNNTLPLNFVKIIAEPESLFLLVGFLIPKLLFFFEYEKTIFQNLFLNKFNLGICLMDDKQLRMLFYDNF